VKNDDMMDLIVVFCILFVFMLVLYCFCVATEFSANKDLYIASYYLLSFLRGGGACAAEADEEPEEEEHLDEAFVTLATNDVYAVGAMVLAYSLRATCTTRQLVVMVTPDVTPSVRDVLAQFFDRIVDVLPIDSNDFDNLSLLNRQVSSNHT